VTQATKKLLEQFEALPDLERSELVTELALRLALAPHDGPTDDDLVSAADQLFLEIDKHEQS
jgi:hypothetical protein